MIGELGWGEWGRVGLGEGYVVRVYGMKLNGYGYGYQCVKV